MRPGVSFVVALFCIITRCLLADTGVIIPSDRESPDPAELSIESLKLRIEIDSGHATVHWDEVFHNKTGRVLEGTYVLTLPGGAAVSDFAVWDDVTRIPGVILERKRAGELYSQIRNETIDPGLLESGEISESSAPGEARHSTRFSVKIVPIPAYGYKRIKAEYRQELALNELASELVLPLKSSSPDVVQNLAIDLTLRSPQAITKFDTPGYALTILSQTPNAIAGTFEAARTQLDRDFTLHYRLANDAVPRVQAYRNPGSGDPGYFEASAILPGAQEQPRAQVRTVVILFDTSLSMQWEKLERSFQALEATLRSLTPADRFNVLVFNSEVAPAKPEPVHATTENIARALDFARTSRLRGGTNLQKAFEAAFAQAAGQDSYVVLLSDGGLTEGPITAARFTAWFKQRWSALSAGKRPHIYNLAIGDDADLRLLRQLSSFGGVFEQVGSTEPLEFKLNGFLHKIGLAPLSAVNFSVSPSVHPQLIYRLGDDNFPGARAAWVGEYSNPGSAEFQINRESTRTRLPENDTGHPYLPASWARARVDALLEKIDREGEDKGSIDEIIRLSRRYHFVTPYTSFLAVPRALLRPRLIRPGDPLLRVRTDSSIVSVIALFPFGLVKPLRYVGAEDIWQTRFLAPPDLADGVHTVRLVLRDRAGHTYRERKTFIISSHPPVVRVQLAQNSFRPGVRIPVRVQASASTRTIAVRLYGAPPLFLHWNETEKSNTGVLSVPPDLPAGRYSLHVTAEDIAHNVSHQEVPVEVLP